MHLLPPAEAATLPSSLPPLVLADTRGPYDMLVYSNASSDFVCIWDSGLIGVGGGNGETLPPPTDDSIGAPGVAYDRIRDGSLTYAHGHAGAPVTGVTLVLADGTRVEATVQNGFYAAWWPSKTDVISAAVTTSAGVRQQDFGDTGPNAQGPPPE